MAKTVGVRTTRSHKHVTIEPGIENKIKAAFDDMVESATDPGLSNRKGTKNAKEL